MSGGDGGGSSSTCYLIGLGTSINFFMEVLVRAFNVFIWKKGMF